MSGRVRGKKKKGFRPPIKQSMNSDCITPVLSLTQSSSCSIDHHSDMICHTVLSYCDNHEQEDTQPLSMFSGERRRVIEDELDDSLFPLDDPFSKLDDPISTLDSEQDNSNQSGLQLDGPSIATGDSSEQCVPVSPASSTIQQERTLTENMDTDQEEQIGRDIPLRRVFKPPSSSKRCYNLDLLPKHYRKTPARTRHSVKWYNNISILGDRERDNDVAGSSLSVYEVPLSANDEVRVGQSDKVPAVSKNNLSVSRLDVSHTSRTRDEQVVKITSNYRGN